MQPLAEHFLQGRSVAHDSLANLRLSTIERMLIRKMVELAPDPLNDDFINMIVREGSARLAQQPTQAVFEKIRIKAQVALHTHITDRAFSRLVKADDRTIYHSTQFTAAFFESHGLRIQRKLFGLYECQNPDNPQDYHILLPMGMLQIDGDPRYIAVHAPITLQPDKYIARQHRLNRLYQNMHNSDGTNIVADLYLTPAVALDRVATLRALGFAVIPGAFENTFLSHLASDFLQSLRGQIR